MTTSAVDDTVTVVGIGSSAGGLLASRQFLSNVVAICKSAFVVVSHLNPYRTSCLAELLQSATPMPVVQIEEGMEVEPAHVYVIPPNRNLSLRHGRLHLHALVKRGGQIDYFFHSLAHDNPKRSVGVILSGALSDGACGLRAIKEAGGGAFAQNPTTAQFDSMPRSAIKTGLMDGVDAAEKLASQIETYLSHPLCCSGPPCQQNQRFVDTMTRLQR
jgi:two-component system CheB/CheR fusion protein